MPSPLERVRFTLKKPGHGRVSFSILRDVVKPDGKRVSSIFKDERVDAVNRLLRHRLKDQTTCERECREIIRALYQEIDRKRGRPVFNEENRQLLSRYWDTRYRHRNNVEPRSAWDELNRAVDAVGPLSLLSTSQAALQAAVNRKAKGNRQRRLVASLNQMLRFAGRTIQLHPDKKERRTVKYLSLEEFKRVRSQVSEPTYDLLFAACIATGARTGEAFALEAHHLSDGAVFIQTQLDRREISRETKNRRERHTVVIPSLLNDLRAWIDLPEKQKLAIRNKGHARILAAACQKVFPENPKKWCGVKELRHSYAIWLLGKGVSIGLLAQSLGNSEQVCQENYAGFVLAPENITAIKAIIKKRR